MILLKATAKKIVSSSQAFPHVFGCSRCFMLSLGHDIGHDPHPLTPSRPPHSSVPFSRVTFRVTMRAAPHVVQPCWAHPRKIVGFKVTTVSKQQHYTKSDRSRMADDSVTSPRRLEGTDSVSRRAYLSLHWGEPPTTPFPMQVTRMLLWLVSLLLSLFRNFTYMRTLDGPQY